jgi:simple sugar transport system ATP-binding protein
MTFSTPRESLDAGIATVFQDLAMVPLMAIWRNFFLGSEPTKGWGPFQRFDQETAKRSHARRCWTWASTSAIPTNRGTLSGGERQSGRDRAGVHFGAKLLILDEPTSALGVKQAGVV